MKTKKSNINKVDFSNLPFGKIFTDNMTIANYSKKSWSNFKLLPYGPIELLPSISALHYGQEVFEGMKVFYSKNGDALLYRPDAHFARINRSLERLDMPAIPKKLFDESVEKLIKKDSAWLKRAGQLYIRPFVFATTPYLGVASSEDYKFIVLACPVGPYYTKPLHLKIETEYSRSAPGGVGFAKAAGNYAASLLPTRLAVEKGFDQLVWTDSATHTRIEESGTMNIMCVINGKIVTPKLSNTILAGITRDSILTLARENNIAVLERDILVKELIEALENNKVDEIFGAGTAATIISVESITSGEKKYLLKKPSEKSISNLLYKQIESIKRGEQKDIHNWVRKIKLSNK